MSLFVLPKSFLVLLLSVGLSSGITAQYDDVLVFNADPISKSRYFDKKGSPYILSEFLPGNLIATSGKKIESIPMNYNAYEKDIEVVTDNGIIALDSKAYLSFELPAENHSEINNEDPTSKMLFIKGVHPKFTDKFVQILHGGTLYKLIKDHHSGLSKQKIETVGKTINVERFDINPTYYFMSLTDLNSVRLNKKDILKRLPVDDQIEQFIKSEGLKLNQEADVVKLLVYCEALD